MKQVRLQSLRRRYELIHMEEDQKISEYFLKLFSMVNQIKTCGKAISNHTVEERVTRFPYLGSKYV